MTSILRSIGFKKPKHTKLSEEWTDCQEPVKEGITFYCKYIGSTPIEQSSNATMTSHAVKHILSMAKAKGKKLPNIALFISPTYLSGTVMAENGNSGQEGKEEKKDLKKSEAKKEKGKKLKKRQELASHKLVTEDANEVVDQKSEAEQEMFPLFNISIYRIPYCFAEATYDRIVAFVSTNSNGTHECHAIIAGKRKIAQAIALTISQAFDIAFDRLNGKKKSTSPTDPKPTFGTNRLSAISTSDDDSKSNGSDGSDGTHPNEFPTLTLSNRSFTSSRLRCQSEKENDNSQEEDVKKQSAELKLLINLEDEPKLNYSTTKLAEKPLLDLDDLRDLF